MTVKRKDTKNILVEIHHGREIKIKHCSAGGKMFANITDGSIHTVIEPPNQNKDSYDGVWVMGVTEPVKVLYHEFEFIKE